MSEKRERHVVHGASQLHWILDTIAKGGASTCMCTSKQASSNMVAQFGNSPSVKQAYPTIEWQLQRYHML
jgi:hypothetical protein